MAKKLIKPFALKNTVQHLAYVKKQIAEGVQLTYPAIEDIITRNCHAGTNGIHQSFSELIGYCVDVWKTCTDQQLSHHLTLLIQTGKTRLMYDATRTMIQFLNESGINFNAKMIDQMISASPFFGSDFLILTTKFGVTSQQFYTIFKHNYGSMLLFNGTVENDNFKKRLVELYPDLISEQMAQFNSQNELIILISSFLSKTAINGTIPDLYINYSSAVVEKLLWLRCKFKGEKYSSPTIDDMHKLLELFSKPGIQSHKIADSLNSLISFKITPDIRCLELLKNIPIYQDVLLNIIDTFVVNGLQMSYTTIGKILECGSYVKNIGRFNLVYGEELYHICFMNNNFPPEYVKQMEEIPLLKFRLMFGKPELDHMTLVMFGIKNKFIIDRYCIDTAIRSKNGQILSYLKRYITIVPSPLLLPVGPKTNRHQTYNCYTTYETEYIINLREKLIKDMVTKEYLCEPVFVELDLLL